MLVVFFLIGVYGVVFFLCLISDETDVLQVVLFIAIYILGGMMLFHPVSKRNKLPYFIALTISPL